MTSKRQTTAGRSEARPTTRATTRRRGGRARPPSEQQGPPPPPPPPCGNRKGGGPRGDWLTGVRTPDPLEARPMEWFAQPDIPRGFLVLLTAPPSAGKSTYLMALAACARRPLILHGDDDYARTVIPRLVASAVAMPQALTVAPSDRWQFPRHLDRLLDLVRHEGVDLVAIDPVDDYVEPGFDEDRSAPVRKLLYGLGGVAAEGGPPVVVVRHPGKDPANLLPGSKAWRAVPRIVLQLIPDPEDRHRGILHHAKNHVAELPPDREYSLEGAEGRHRRFVLGDPVPPLVAKHIMEVSERLERTMIGMTRVMVRGVLADGGWHEGAVLHAKCKELAVSPSTLSRALEAENCLRRSRGHGADFVWEWKLP